MDRATFAGGPAYLVHDSNTIQMEDETWKLTVSDVVVDRSTNLQAKVGSSKDYSLGKLTFTPIGTTANLAALFTYFFGPFQPTNIGSLIFPGTDKPAVIQTKAGKSITLAAAMVTKPPPVNFRSNTNIFGQAEITCLIENNTDGTTAGDFVAVATSAYSEPSFNPLTILASTYAVAWGATSPFDDIEVSREGISFEVTPQLGEKATNNAGLLNYRLDGVEAVARFQPVNCDEEDFLETMMLLDGSLSRGQMVANRGAAFTVTGDAAGKPTLTIANAVPVDPVDINFSRTEDRIGQVTLQAHRSSSLAALYALGVVS